jgi:hypothetical protein
MLLVVWQVHGVRACMHVRGHLGVRACTCGDRERDNTIYLCLYLSICMYRTIRPRGQSLGFRPKR